jgi:hypothetical protein
MDMHPAMIGAEEPNYEMFADAIYRAEGGDKAKAPYGVLSIKTKNADEARRITINSAKKNYGRWLHAGKPGTFVEFMANRWTPPSADPKGNANWIRNVPAIYAQLLGEQTQPQITPVPAGYIRTVMPNYKL